MSKLRDATLVFLIKKNGAAITNICLAMKKRGFGANRWNGLGGKVHEGETIEEAAIRESKEEACIECSALDKIANIEFRFPHHPDFDQRVHAYFVESWQGEPVETEEMKPQWFVPENIPYNEMWPDDIYWLPEVLEGKKLKATFIFGEGDTVLEKKITEAKTFN